MASFNLDKVIEWLPQATTMMGVPTFYTRLLGDNRFSKNRVNHMRLFVSGSAPCWQIRTCSLKREPVIAFLNVMV